MTYTCPLYTTKEEKKNNRGIANFNFLALFGLVILLAVFLVESDGLIGRSYKLVQYEQDLKEQQGLIKKLENKQAEQTAFSNLEEAAKNMNLVPAGKVTYLESAGAPVALSR